MSPDLALVLFGFAHIETRESYRVCMVRRWLSGCFCEPINTVQPGGWADRLDDTRRVARVTARPQEPGGSMSEHETILKNALQAAYDEGRRDGIAFARVSQESEPSGALGWLAEECMDLRCINEPLADAGDYNVEWVVIEHYMAEPRERVVGSGRTPAEAIEDARRTLHADRAVVPLPEEPRNVPCDDDVPEGDDRHGAGCQCSRCRLPEEDAS